MPVSHFRLMEIFAEIFLLLSIYIVLLLLVVVLYEGVLISL